MNFGIHLDTEATEAIVASIKEDYERYWDNPGSFCVPVAELIEALVWKNVGSITDDPLEMDVRYDCGDFNDVFIGGLREMRLARWIETAISDAILALKLTDWLGSNYLARNQL